MEVKQYTPKELDDTYSLNVVQKRKYGNKTFTFFSVTNNITKETSRMFDPYPGRWTLDIKATIIRLAKSLLP